MLIHVKRAVVVGMAAAACLAAGPAGAQKEVTLADLLAGSALPHTMKLKELGTDWHRVSIGGEMTLGMGSMFQSMMQAVGSLFGGGGSDALYTRGATVRIG